MWYLQYLIQPKFWALFQASGGPLAAEHFSGIGSIVQCGIYLIIQKQFEVVLQIPTLGQFSGGGHMGPHLEGVWRALCS